MPHVIHGSERRALVPGRSLYDEADQLSVVVPASCRRTGRCHECVVEIRSGMDQLSARTGEEAFLGPQFRLACQATCLNDAPIVLQKNGVRPAGAL